MPNFGMSPKILYPIVEDLDRNGRETQDLIESMTAELDSVLAPWTSVDGGGAKGAWDQAKANWAQAATIMPADIAAASSMLGSVVDNTVHNELRTQQLFSS